MKNVIFEHKDFDQCARIVFAKIAAVCTSPKPDPDSFDGAMCLGPSYKPPGKPKVTGVGLDDKRRQDLWDDLNHFLDMVGASKKLKPSQVGSKTTISSLVNAVYNLWP
jgi:hypothetical protein